MSLPLARAVARFLTFGKKDERSFFDAAYYRSAYKDIAAAGVDPYPHFMQHGWREGRNPSASFSTLFYRDHHLDGDALNPLTHYVEAGGTASGLPTLPASEAAFVDLQRAVVKDAFVAAYYRSQAEPGTRDLLGDYLLHGWRVGRSPSPLFDPAKYQAANQFIETLGVSPLYHHASQMRMMSRSPSARKAKAGARKVSRATIETILAQEFDGDFYLRSNPDVRAAQLDPLSHFIETGWREGRDPHPLFDSAFYISNNIDVATGDLNPFYHYLTIGRAEGRRGNPVGPHLYPNMVAPSEADWARATPAADTLSASVIVIIPVYGGFNETLAAIHAVLTAPQKTAFALHVINDATPDATLDAALVDLASRRLFSYSRNEVNVGFVRSCNRGLRQFADKQIVLLNADAAVSNDWLDRLVAHAQQDSTIATITPLSNNATICSYPVMNGNNAIEPGMSAAELDQMAAICNAGRVTDIPTGVGFCFYMSRASRDAVGLFDEDAFGRGYGEENDFCLRAAKAGFRNVLAEDIFVYHAGEVSFSAFVAAEYGPGQKALLGKHPDYTTRVRRYIEADPGLEGRMRLDLRRLADASKPNSIIFISHALDGGILTHIDHLEARLREAGTTIVHIRVGVHDRWSIEVRSKGETAPYCPNLRAVAFNQMRPLLETFLGWLKPRAFHLHSLVGFDWSATNGLLDLVRRTGLPYYFTLHDYSIVCHRHNLIRNDGSYCGLPDIAACRACVAGDRSYPESIDPGERRETFARFLDGATGVFAPSADIRTRLKTAGAGYDVTLRPHEEPAIAALPLPPPGRAIRDIVTIGAIGDHKGASVLLNLAQDAKARALPLRFHIVGYSNAARDMAANDVTETGPYSHDAEAIALVAAIAPAMILLPSIWPETFCFTLSMAFGLGVPPVVFDIGAQAERVAEAGFGFILPYALIHDAGALNDRLLTLPFEASAREPEVKTRLYADILRDYYGMDG